MRGVKAPMSYNSIRPHQVLLISAKKRNLRLSWSQTDHNLIAEDWKKTR